MDGWDGKFRNRRPVGEGTFLKNYFESKNVFDPKLFWPENIFDQSLSFDLEKIDPKNLRAQKGRVGVETFFIRKNGRGGDRLIRQIAGEVRYNFEFQGFTASNQESPEWVKFWTVP